MISHYGTPANATSRIASSAATINATVAVAAGCCLKGIQGHNASGATRFIKLYDQVTAPNPATDTPKKVLAIPAGTPFAFDFSAGYQLMRGLAYCITTGAADTDATAVAAGDILGLNVDFVQ